METTEEIMTGIHSNESPRESRNSGPARCRDTAQQQDEIRSLSGAAPIIRQSRAGEHAVAANWLGQRSKFCTLLASAATDADR